MLIKASRNPKIWVMCLSVCMTHETVTSDSIDVYAVPCKSKKACLKALEKSIRETVQGNYEGYESEEETEEIIDSDIEEVWSSAEPLGTNGFRYKYSVNDREAVWKIYPIRVKE